MNEYGFLWVIAGVLFIGAMSPGPCFFVVAQNAIAKSRSHGLATALGTALGVLIFAILAGFGVIALIEGVPSIYLGFKLVGGVYLLTLAIRIWRGAKQPLTTKLDTLDSTSHSQYSLGRAFMTGLITQISNPKTALVIASIFAAFIPAQAPPNTTALVAVIAFLIDFFWYAIVAVSLSNKASRALYGKAKAGIDRTASVFIGLVGVRLLTSY